jgi:hypothetical protein
MLNSHSRIVSGVSAIRSGRAKPLCKGYAPFRGPALILADVFLPMIAALGYEGGHTISCRIGVVTGQTQYQIGADHFRYIAMGRRIHHWRPLVSKHLPAPSSNTLALCSNSGHS